MKAIIPAAGYATRMYPLTLATPKPLLEAGNKPIIEHIISQILGIPEVNEIIIVTNSKFFKNFLEWQKGFKCRAPVKIIDDKTDSNENRLGSIGDLNLAIESEKINEPVVIVNADNVFTFDLLKAYAFFKEKNSDVIVLYDVKSFEEAKKMGSAEFDAEGKVTAFVEKPQNPKTALVSIGIYFYKKETLPLFKKYIKEGNSPDKTGNLLEWLHKQTDVFVFPFSGKEDHWFDIGSIETFEQFKKDFPKWKEIMEKRGKK